MTKRDAPRHAFQGQLFNSDGTSVRVSISHTDEQILLTVIGNPGDLFDKSLIDMTLESTGGRGVLRTRGTGHRIGDHTIRFELDDAADLVQRRQFVRVTAAQRVILEDDKENVLADTYAVNISGGGVLIAAPRKLELAGGTRVHFILYLGEEEAPVYGIGRVIRNGVERQVAVAFEEISRRDRERVVKFVFDRQRLALAMTRGDSD